jgi:hypothetical protein
MIREGEKLNREKRKGLLPFPRKLNDSKAVQTEEKQTGLMKGELAWIRSSHHVLKEIKRTTNAIY